MMPWDYILSIVGIAGFLLAGKKIWWAWYINIACQFLWFAYAIITLQYGFLIGASLYLIVFTKNAYEWTKEHNAQIAVENAEAVEKIKELQKTLDDMQNSWVNRDKIRKIYGERGEW